MNLQCTRHQAYIGRADLVNGQALDSGPKGKRHSFYKRKTTATFPSGLLIFIFGLGVGVTFIGFGVGVAFIGLGARLLIGLGARLLIGLSVLLGAYMSPKS